MVSAARWTFHACRPTMRPGVERDTAKGAAADLRQCGAWPARFSSGDPKQVLVKQAAQWDADGIFVGVRGLSRLDRLLLGSVSAAIAVRAACSVEVARPAIRRDALDPGLRRERQRTPNRSPFKFHLNFPPVRWSFL